MALELSESLLTSFIPFSVTVTLLFISDEDISESNSGIDVTYSDCSQLTTQPNLN